MIISARRVSLILGIIFLSVIGLIKDVPSAHAAPPSQVINGDVVDIGSIVAEGINHGNGVCEFGTVTVRTTAPANGKTKWIGIIVDKNCRVIVNAKWHGSLREGPVNVVRPLRKALRSESVSIEEASQSQSQVKPTLFANSPTACKDSSQHVYMYGFGGPGDQLTHKYGSIRFCYSGSIANLSNHGGSCSGSTEPTWSWKVDNCVIKSVVWGPAVFVYREGQGSYHCDPINIFPCNLSNPAGYFHSLTDHEDGYGNGVSHCSAVVNGTIVAGWGREVLQGCT